MAVKKHTPRTSHPHSAYERESFCNLQLFSSLLPLHWYGILYSVQATSKVCSDRQPIHPVIVLLYCPPYYESTTLE